MSKTIRIFLGWCFLALGNIYLYKLERPADAIIIFITSLYLFVTAVFMENKK